ncbi:helix-turn-helix domain-containing protein [Lentzea tibetensis]|uniref:Helix-turn-helix domain-containing protein n=1 Tax=Lentzea tibetensis TaxID=2591470 RepID=A0A563EYA6_9PSEU|nr:helix-turn-helix transcriptional regulator [Lentzea tibetensis]TWP52124.1 helix-turn-helix domain-containing protein [Lentzea tibetensis]
MARSERPLEFDGSGAAEFAAELRLLRQQAGSPTYRELARRAHYSSTTLSDAAGGRKLPTLEVTRAYVRACGGDVETWTRRWHEVTAPVPVQVERDERELNHQVLVACLLALVVLYWVAAPVVVGVPVTA